MLSKNTLLQIACRCGDVLTCAWLHVTTCSTNPWVELRWQHLTRQRNLLRLRATRPVDGNATACIGRAARFRWQCTKLLWVTARRRAAAHLHLPEAADSAARRKRLSLDDRLRLPSADRLQRCPREIWSHRCIEAVTTQRPI